MASIPRRYVPGGRVHVMILLASFLAGCSTTPVKPQVSRVFATRCMASEVSARALWYAISASMSDATFGTAARQAFGEQHELWDPSRHPTYVTCCRIWLHSDVCDPSEMPVDLFQEHASGLTDTERQLIGAALEAEMEAGIERLARKR